MLLHSQSEWNRMGFPKMIVSEHWEETKKTQLFSMNTTVLDDEGPDDRQRIGGTQGIE